MRIASVAAFGVLLSLTWLTAGDRASAQTITSLGVHPTSGQPLRPTCVSDAGAVLSGNVHDGVAIHAFRWTSTGGMQDLGIAPGATFSLGHGISDDGDTIAGDEGGGANGGGAFLWTSAGGLQGLGSLGFNTAMITGVSGDGATLVGFGQAADGSFHSFLWTSTGGMQLLDPLNLFGDDGQPVVNEDGTAIAGNYYLGGAFLWTSSAGMQSLAGLPGHPSSVTADVSADGTAVVGYGYSWTSSTGYTFLEAVRWTAAGGTQDLGVLAGDEFSYASGVSGDGSIVVGTSYRITGGYAARSFLWTEGTGMVELAPFLSSIGIDLTGWDLGDVGGISPDGSALFGLGIHNGAQAGWVVTDLCTGAWSNYGTGWAGTLGVPGLVASNVPVIGADVTVSIDNSSPNATVGLLLLGFAPTSIPTSKGGTLLVATPWIVTPLPLPVGGLDLTDTIPADLALCGFEVDLQCLEIDSGASRRLSFTPGLSLVLGI